MFSTLFVEKGDNRGKSLAKAAGVTGSTPFRLRPIGPFRLDLTAWVLRRRPENRVDRWDGERYERTFAAGRGVFEVFVTQARAGEAPELEVTLSGDLYGRTRAKMSRVIATMLGTEVDLSGFSRMLSLDGRLAGLAGPFEGLKPPRFPTVFEALVNGIVFQQLSLATGVALLNRLVTACGPASGSGSHAFPSPSEILALDASRLRGLGFSFSKARTLLDSAAAASEGLLDAEGLAGMSDDEVLAVLQPLKGVGRWTAEYVLLRGLGRLSVFPGDDVGARNKLCTWLNLTHDLDYAAVKAITAAWQPYAGLVYFCLLLKGLAERGYLRPGGG
jgi:DNA-3-methyladenine glycosylase II